jgi:formiminotetrahydrofolate cyclodeaminase
LEHSFVDASHLDKTVSVKTCAAELCNAKARLKDVLADAISNIDLYEVEVSTARVERRYTHLTEENVLQAQECKERIDKEVKQRVTRR